MKDYYVNAARDLIIRDTETGDVIVLPRIESVRVFLGGDIKLGDFEGVNRGGTVEDADRRGGYTNHNFDPKTGKVKVRVGKGGKKPRYCKNCGEPGHRKDNCPKKKQ